MIFVLNAGSSSLKVEVFDLALTSVVSGSVTNIGTDGVLRLGENRTECITTDMPMHCPKC
jgi:acetate kinase